MRPKKQLRILLSEGSSLSAREAITALGLAGHSVEIVSSDPICLGRFSRFVRRVHRAPACGVDPDGYLAAVLDIVKTRTIDVVLPVHEQAYLFAAARDRFSADVGLALASFDAFEKIQSKTAFCTLLTQLGVPQPASDVVTSEADFNVDRPYPFFVKAAFGTASASVWRVADPIQKQALLVQLQNADTFAEGILVQSAVTGSLERAQAVFDRGGLIACHIYRQLEEGPGGGDILKRSVNREEARECVERIGGALAWHGALSFDYIVDDATGGVRFIDANPRLVEPMNAWLSGVDLAGALLRISLGEAPSPQPPGREGVVTRLGLMGLLDAARRRGRRSDVLREIGRLARSQGRYRGTREELVPLVIDPWCAIPVAVVVARLLRSPQAWAKLSTSAVAAYSLTPSAIGRLRGWHSQPKRLP